MSLKYEVISSSENKDYGYHYMILLIDGEPYRGKTMTGKVQRYSAEAGSSGEARMHKIAEKFISEGHDVKAVERELTDADNVIVYQLTKEE